MNYTSLTTAISSWSERTYDATLTDQFIELWEAELNRLLGSNYRRKATAVIATDSAGSGTIPTAATNIISLTRDVLGSVPLRKVSWAALIERNPYEYSFDASVYAIRGTTLQVAPIVEDNFNAVYWSTLTALSGSNLTNWLIDIAPDIYLAGCRGYQAAYEEDFNTSSVFLAQARMKLGELISQANVAEYGDAEVTLPMATP